MFDKTTIAIKPMIQPLWNFASLLFYLLNISTYSHVNVPESNMVIDEGPHMNHAQAAFLRWQLVNHGIRSDDGIHYRNPYQHKLIS
jgi:hypothetical protein